MPRFVTADAVAGIPTLADVPPKDHPQVLDDAGTLLAYVAANEWADDQDVRNHFEQADWSPDRFNLALGVLRDTGRLLVFNDAHAQLLNPPEPATSPVAEPAAPDDQAS